MSCDVRLCSLVSCDMSAEAVLGSRDARLCSLVSCDMSAEAVGKVLARHGMSLEGNEVLSNYVRCDTILPFFWLRPRRFFRNVLMLV